MEGVKRFLLYESPLVCELDATNFQGSELYFDGNVRASDPGSMPQHISDHLSTSAADVDGPKLAYAEELSLRQA